MDSPAVEKKRLFVAVFPSAPVVEKLWDAIRQLAAQLPPTASVRWVRPEQIHLTLRFLGSVDSGGFSPLESAIQRACRQCAPHSLEALGVGCFPGIDRPRVLWAGTAGALEEPQKLKTALDQVLAPLGYPAETRLYHPHLTFGRVGNLDRLARDCLKKAWGPLEKRHFGAWGVERIDLMQSVLSPKGATYRLMKSFPLGPGG